MDQIPKPRVRLRSWRLPALVGLLLLLQLFWPYRGWHILLVGLGGAWLLSALWVRSLARGLHLVREMRFGWAQVGDQMLERLRLVNEGWAPAVWAEVMDHSTLPSYRGSRGVSVAGGRSIRWHIASTCTRRGLFTLGPTSLQTGDPFGIYTVSLHYPDSLPLLVLPPVVPLPHIEVARGGRTGEGRPRPNAPERTVSAAGVRGYLPGDSQRWIHWRTTARRGSLFVRMFDGAPASDWWILVDMDRHVQVGEGEDSTEEHAIVLAASLADQGLRSGQAVGLAARGERLVWLSPREGEAQRWAILQSLALISAGVCPLAEFLAGVRLTFAQHTSAVIITPAVDTTWIEPLVRLMRRGATPTVLLLDRVSFGGVGSLSLTQALLADLGVAHYVVTRDLLERSEVRPGEQWMRGRPAKAGQPRGRAWRVLSG